MAEFEDVLLLVVVEVVEDWLSIGVVVVLIGDLLVVVLVFLVYLVGCFFSVFCYWVLLLLLLLLLGWLPETFWLLDLFTYVAIPF